MELLLLSFLIIFCFNLFITWLYWIACEGEYYWAEVKQFSLFWAGMMLLPLAVLGIMALSDHADRVSLQSFLKEWNSAQEKSIKQQGNYFFLEYEKEITIGQSKVKKKDQEQVSQNLMKELGALDGKSEEEWRVESKLHLWIPSIILAFLINYLISLLVLGATDFFYRQISPIQPRWIRS